MPRAARNLPIPSFKSFSKEKEIEEDNQTATPPRSYQLVENCFANVSSLSCQQHTDIIKVTLRLSVVTKLDGGQRITKLNSSFYKEQKKKKKKKKLKGTTTD